MDRTSGQGRATLVQGDVELDARDAALLEEIGRTGSVAEASSNLGRSRARDLARIETLEDAFGKLVDRHRGGSDGGGSRLTDTGTRLLNRYGRLQVAVTATAQVPETVLDGTVTALSGEIAEVSTQVGPIRALHDGVTTGTSLQVRVGADAITLLTADSDSESESTSARNRLRGTVVDIEPGETVSTICIDVDETIFKALITEESRTILGLQNDSDVVLTWKATATRLANGSTQS